MRPLLLLPLILAITACDASKSASSTKPETALAAPTVVPPQDVKTSVVRINSTQQDWNPWQPWEKNPPRQRRALAAIVGPQLVLTTSELTADATYLEFESADGTRFTPAKVIAVDYEANLALLGPASEKDGDAFFKDTTPFVITTPPKLGDTLQVLQVEENGVALETPGILQSIDLTASLLPDQVFLTYMVKASMQSAASSYSLPVLRDGKLAGVLISYNDKDQICDVAPTDLITRFIKLATAGNYHGFPSLGVAIARTEDTSFRQWLKLTDEQGGIYIKSVRKGGAADLAGVKEGDVLLGVDGKSIDRRGYYEHPTYGSLSWGHLVRGEKSIGDIITLSLLRDGKPVELKATLSREEEGSRLVPTQVFNKAPNYLLKGGFVFQELSLPILEGFGEDWRSRAPLNLLDAYQNPEHYKDLKRVVFLSGVIPTPATVGYEQLRSLMVRKVNGKDIKDMKSLIEAFKGNMNELHSIELDNEHLTIYLNESISNTVDSQLLQRGISHLSHVE